MTVLKTGTDTKLKDEGCMLNLFYNIKFKKC